MNSAAARLESVIARHGIDPVYHFLFEITHARLQSG